MSDHSSITAKTISASLDGFIRTAVAYSQRLFTEWHSKAFGAGLLHHRITLKNHQSAS